MLRSVNELLGYGVEAINDMLFAGRRQFSAGGTLQHSLDNLKNNDEVYIKVKHIF